MKYFRLNRIILLNIIFSFLLTLKSFSQEENGKVNNFENKTYEEYSLGEIVVIGEKTPLIKKVTRTTTVTAEELEAKNVKTVAEALIYVAGLRVSTGRKNEPNVYIHGLDQSKILILIDGVPYYETKYGKLDLNAIPIDNIAKIEIEKGVSSVLYGPNALGGIINIITKKSVEKQTFDFLLERSDYETYRTSVSLGRKLNKFSYWINYTYYDSKGWYMSDGFNPKVGTVKYRPGGTQNRVLEDGDVRDNSAVRSHNFWAKLGLELSENSQYYINFHYLNMYKECPYPIGEFLTNKVFLNKPAFSQFARMPRYDNWGIDFSAKQKIGKKITLKGKIFYHFHLDDYKSYHNETFEELLSISRYKDWMYGIILTPEIKLSDTNTLRLGFQYRKDVHRERDDAYLPFEKYSSSTGSLAVENELKLLKNVSVIAGLQYDWFRVDTAKSLDLDNSGNFQGYEELDKPSLEDHISPMIGIHYSLSKDTEVYASLARKIRFPTLNQLYSSRSGNPNLKPEKSWNYLAGISHVFGKSFRGEFSVYYHDIKDWITRDLPTIAGRYENKGKISIAGIEATAQFTPLENLYLEINYTYTYARDRSPERVTSKVLNVSKHKVDAVLDYTLPRMGLKVTLVGLYMGKVWGQLPTASNPDLPAVEIDDYFVLNAKVSKEFKDCFELYLGMNNLFDEDYQSELDFPAPGRNLYAGVRFSF